jgi:hypothetical protein
MMKILLQHFYRINVK